MCVPEQGRDLGLGRFLLRRKAQRLIARRFGERIAFAICGRAVGSVVQFHNRHDFKAAALTDDEVCDLSVELGPQRPAGIFAEFAVVGEKRRKRNLRKNPMVGQGPSQPIKEFRLVRREQGFALEPGKPWLPASYQKKGSRHTEECGYRCEIQRVGEEGIGG